MRLLQDSSKPLCFWSPRMVKSMFFSFRPFLALSIQIFLCLLCFSFPPLVRVKPRLVVAFLPTSVPHVQTTGVSVDHGTFIVVPYQQIYKYMFQCDVPVLSQVIYLRYSVCGLRGLLGGYQRHCMSLVPALIFFQTVCVVVC